MMPRLAGYRSKHAADGQGGSALLVVLVMLGMIAVLASVVTRSVSGAAVTLAVARAAWRSDADLRAGIELGAATILKLGEEMRGAEAFVDLPDRRIAVRVTNERARIDINLAGANVLVSLLEKNGMRENDAAALAEGIIERREGFAAEPIAPGPPNKAGAAGAQSRSPVRHPFLHPTQLASVPGFPKQLARTILPLTTVASGSDQIDPDLADDRVLRALPGASAGSVDAFISARDGNAGRDAAILLLGVEKQLMTAEAAPGWRIEISTQGQEGRVRRGEAVIAILRGDSEPYRVLYVLNEREQLSP